LFYIYSCFRLYHFIDWKTKKTTTKAQEEQGIFIYHRRNTYGLKLLKVIIQKAISTLSSKNLHNAFFKLSNSIGNRQNLASPISEFMGIMVIAILLWYGGNMVLIEKPKRSFIYCLHGISLQYTYTGKINIKASYSKRENAAAERFRNFGSAKPITSKPDAIKTHFESAITIKNINFKYEEESVLKDFSLEVKRPNDCISWTVGSGKSTIANLLTVFMMLMKGLLLYNKY
jgi:subfamily B ATP-binding cassette protein MsbA